MYKQLTLTKQWKYNIFVQMLYGYFQLAISDTLVGSFLDVLFLLFTIMLSDFHKKPIWTKDEVTEKGRQNNLCEEH